MTRSVAKVLKLSLLISVFLTVTKAYAIGAFADNFIIINQVSSSGKTISVDRGTTEDIGSNDFGVLLLKEDSGDGGFVYKPIAKIRAIKAYGKDSVWIVYKEFIPGLIERGKKFLMLSETALLKGRIDLNYKRTGLVVKKEPKQELEDFLLEGDELAQKQKKYQVINEPHKKEKHLDRDFDLIDINKWENSMGDGRLFVSGIYRSPHGKDFVARKRVQTFEKMVIAFLKKYNDPTYRFEKLYAEQNYEKNTNLKSASVYKSYKKRYDDDIRNRAEKEARFYRDLQKRGDAWSDDYSDKELSELISKIGIIKERERRKTLLAYKYDYQLFAGMGINLINNENLTDSQNTQQSKIDFEFSYESYFARKYFNLRNFSFEISGRRSQDAFYGGDLNTKIVDYSMAGHINWYPLLPPSTIGENIYFIGTHFRLGLARLSVESTNEVGNYQIRSFPTLRAGLKYNFKNGYGFRLAGTYESVTVNRLVRNADDGTLPDRGSYVEGKVGVSLSKFF